MRARGRAHIWGRTLGDGRDRVDSTRNARGTAGLGRLLPPRTDDASAPSLLTPPAAGAELAGAGCCSRSKHSPFCSRTRTPARRMPISSRSPGTRCIRWSTLVTFARRNVSDRLDRLSTSRKASTVFAVRTRPMSSSPYFAVRRSPPELSAIGTGRGTDAASCRARSGASRECTGGPRPGPGAGFARAGGTRRGGVRGARRFGGREWRSGGELESARITPATRLPVDSLGKCGRCPHCAPSRGRRPP